MYGPLQTREDILLIDNIRKSAVGSVSGNFYYGWAIVAVAALCMFSSGPGQSHTFSVFIDPISDSLGLSKSAIASAYAVATLAAAFLLPKAGRLLDRFGPRKTLLTVTTLLGIACMFFGAAANVIWLALGFALLRFMGQGSIMMCSANLVSQWFLTRRGFAMSLMGLGFAASMAIHPQLGEYLIAQFGWRKAWVSLGLITWVTMIPVLLFLVYDKPESIGLRIDGERVQEGKEASVLTGLTLSDAKKETAFYILCGVWFVIGGLVTVLHFFQVSVLTSQGLTSAEAARLFSVSALTAAVTMPFIGRVYDTFKTRYVIATEMFLVATAMVAMTLVTSFFGGVVYAIIFGLCNAFMLTMFGYIWPRYFGRAHLGSIQGQGQMLGVIGSSLAPIPVGFAIDVFGSATQVLMVLAVLAVLTGVVTVIKLRTPRGVETAPGLE